MNGKELRIGNLVSNNNSISTVRVVGEDCAALEDGSADTESLQPIPLTEEFLLWNGFEKEKWEGYNPRGCCDYVLKGKIRLEKRDVFTFSCYGHPYDEYVEENCFEIELLYVHQLQNLLYVLTGLELTQNPF